MKKGWRLQLELRLAKVREKVSSLILDVGVKYFTVKYIFCPDQDGRTNRCMCVCVLVPKNDASQYRVITLRC